MLKLERIEGNINQHNLTKLDEILVQIGLNKWFTDKAKSKKLQAFINYAHDIHIAKTNANELETEISILREENAKLREENLQHIIQIEESKNAAKTINFDINIPEEKKHNPELSEILPTTSEILPTTSENTSEVIGNAPKTTKTTETTSAGQNTSNIIIALLCCALFFVSYFILEAKRENRENRETTLTNNETQIHKKELIIPTWQLHNMYKLRASGVEAMIKELDK